VVAPYDESDNSHEFGFCPIKILDGMAAGKPVVASDTPWIREILSDGEGIVTEDIAGGIERLRDDSLREEKGEKALKKIEDELSWRHTAENIYNVYTGLVDIDGG
ncbi:MAG: glycosyltransferase, partial [Candidatus Nanohaloarchaea archaeon]|nr:glycosyltransferase [Candidatus Nanohaloarchaea archaeon]